MRGFPPYCLCIVSVLLLACSAAASHAPGDDVDSGASSFDSSAANDTSSSDVGAVDTARVESAALDTTPAADAAPTKPAAPQMVDVMAMSGALHVKWMLNDTALDAVVLFRRQDAGAYEKAYTLPGTALGVHDFDAKTSGSKYCYQVQTTRGGAASDLSDEMCGTP